MSFSSNVRDTLSQFWQLSEEKGESWAEANIICSYPNTVEPVYNDIDLCDTSPIALYNLRYQLIPYC